MMMNNMMMNDMMMIDMMMNGDGDDAW